METMMKIRGNNLVEVAQPQNPEVLHQLSKLAEVKENTLKNWKNNNRIKISFFLNLGRSDSPSPDRHSRRGTKSPPKTRIASPKRSKKYRKNQAIVHLNKSQKYWTKISSALDKDRIILSCLVEPSINQLSSVTGNVLPVNTK